MPEVRMILMTCPEDQATPLVRQALEEKLIACGNIVPGVQSHYWWQGAITRDVEALVVMETAADRLEHAMQRLAEIHPYEVPKLLVFTPVDAHAAYVAWAQASTRVTAEARPVDPTAPGS